MNLIKVNRELYNLKKEIDVSYSLEDAYIDFGIYGDDENTIFCCQNILLHGFFKANEINICHELQTVKIEKDMYENMIIWVESILKTRSIFEWIKDIRNDITLTTDMFNLYRDLKMVNVDFENEFVLFECGW